MEVKLNFTIEEMEECLHKKGYQILFGERDFSRKVYHDKVEEFTLLVKVVSKDDKELPFHFNGNGGYPLEDQQIIHIFNKELKDLIINHY